MKKEEKIFKFFENNIQKLINKTLQKFRITKRDIKSLSAIGEVLIMKGLYLFIFCYFKIIEKKSYKDFLERLDFLLSRSKERAIKRYLETIEKEWI